MKFFTAVSVIALSFTQVSAFAPTTPSFAIRNNFAPVSLVELEAKKSISDLADSEIKGKKNSYPLRC